MKKSLLLIVLSFVVVLSSCKKYEEGPMLSLRSKSARVANTWKVEHATYNGADITSLYADYRETYTKDGVYSYVHGNDAGSGKWEFQNDKEEIKRSGVSGQSTETLFILKLKEKEFWYYVMDGNDRTEVHLIPE